MRHIVPFNAGMSVGSVVGLWHLMWVSLVALGGAKPFMDFVLRLHFIEIEYQLAPFDGQTAMTLIVITFSIGMLLGVAFALIWNWLAGPSAAATGPRGAAAMEG